MKQMLVVIITIIVALAKTEPSLQAFSHYIVLALKKY